MKIINAQVSDNVQPPISRLSASNPHAVSGLPESELPAPSVSVQLSGRGLMRTRLFNNLDPNVEPRILSPHSPTGVMLRSYFLNSQDRELVAQMYELARDEGADLVFVDSLALTWGAYRASNDGKNMGALNQGNSFDLEGHEVFYDFTKKDAVVAQRILQSDGIRTTQLDQGFLRYYLNKDHGALSHPNFEFLEQMVNRFSTVAVDHSPLGPKFARYQPIDKNYVESRSKDIRFKRPVDPNNGEESSSLKRNGRTVNKNPLQTFRDTLYRTFPSAFNKYLIPTLFDMLARLRR